MNKLQKLGGIAALFEAGSYIVTMLYFLVALDYANVVDPSQQVELLIANQMPVALITLVAYVVFGAMLVVLSLALYHRVREASPAMAQVATVFGLIWAALLIGSGLVHNSGLRTISRLYALNPEQTVMTWATIDAVTLGLGGEAEIVGGIWTLLVSLAAFGTGKLPRALNIMGIAIGVLGIISALPGLTMLNALFGITQIIWFVWIGVFMLNKQPEETAE